MALRAATEASVSQAASRPWLIPRGGENSRPMARAARGVAAIINGRRRPSRDWMLSDQEPTSGSITASKARLTARAAPTRAPESPSTAV